MYLTKFENWLHNEGRDKKTIVAYLHAVKSLINWIEEKQGEIFDIKNITSRDLHDYKKYMEKELHRKPATINKNIAALKVYWTFLTDTDLTATNPTFKVKMKSSTKVQDAPRWLSLKEQDKLVDMIRIEKNEWKEKRNRALILVMLKAGLRVSEVSALDRNDIDLSEKMLVVQSGKMGKYREIPINKELDDALHEWLLLRKDDDKAVFISERKTRITTRSIMNVVEKYMTMIGKKESAHSLRHSFCKNLIDAGWSLDRVARLAGHSNIQTTARYTTPDRNDLRKMVDSI